jgi:hypothetical protein
MLSLISTCHLSLSLYIYIFRYIQIYCHEVKLFVMLSLGWHLSQHRERALLGESLILGFSGFRLYTLHVT